MMNAVAIATPEAVDPVSMAAIADALEIRFGDALTPTARADIARHALDHYRGSAVDGFVGILAERRANDMAEAQIRSP